MTSSDESENPTPHEMQELGAAMAQALLDAMGESLDELQPALSEAYEDNE